jgi:uncharacterized protein YegL
VKTEIIAIVDRSGSMNSLAAEAIGGFNAFLEQQKALPGEAKLSLVLFDHEFIQVTEGLMLSDVKSLDRTTYVPRGSTAMNDAIGRSLQGQGERIKNEAWADKVIVCLVTDGWENASKEYTREAVQKLVKEKEAMGWSFVFLFAGLTQAEAMAQTQSYGVNTASPQNLAQSFAGGASGQSVGYGKMSDTLRSLRSGGTAQADPAKETPKP